MLTFLTYFIIFVGFFILYLLWLQVRNNRVCAFLTSVVEWECAKHIAIIEAGGTPTTENPGGVVMLSNVSGEKPGLVRVKVLNAGLPAGVVPKSTGVVRPFAR